MLPWDLTLPLLLRANNVRPYILYSAKSMLFDTLKRRSNTALFRTFL